MHRTPDSPAPSPADTLDLTALSERVGDASLVRPIVELYLELLPERLASISGPAQTSSAHEERVRAVHSLKSASALLGLMELSTSCRNLESAWLRDADAPTVALVDDVMARAVEARAALGQVLASC
jgi:HPt (histidine-containing phosphotransfer) domain-containing protein